MDVRIRSSKKVALMELDGDLNRDSIVEAESYVDAVAGAGCHTIILSFNSMPAIPSTGLHFLLDTHDRLKSGSATGGSNYGKLILANIPEDLGKLVNMLKLDETVEISRTIQNALNKEGVDERSLESGIPGTGKFIIRRADGTEQEITLNHDLNETDLQKIVRLCMQGKLSLNIIEYFHTPGQNVARIPQVAAALGARETDVKEIIQKLTKRALFKPMGADTYNFMPKPDLQRKINRFFELYNQPDRHSHLLKMVLDAENS